MIGSVDHTASNAGTPDSRVRVQSLAEATVRAYHPICPTDVPFFQEGQEVEE